MVNLKVCSRAGCQSYSCTIHSERYGYICSGCLKELAEFLISSKHDDFHRLTVLFLKVPWQERSTKVNMFLDAEFKRE